jgi:hypothetical protein
MSRETRVHEAVVPLMAVMYPQSAPSFEPSQPQRSSSKACDALGADNLTHARSLAETELARGPRCGCCLTPQIHLTRFVGSTLFLDDDPTKLLAAFPRDARGQFTTRLIAACIVLFGRARVSLF